MDKREKGVAESHIDGRAEGDWRDAIYLLGILGLFRGYSFWGPSHFFTHTIPSMHSSSSSSSQGCVVNGMFGFQQSTVLIN